MSGTRARSSVSAAATLARIMNSSISRCASRRSGVITRSTVLWAVRTILRSGRSRSRDARAIGAVERLENGRQQRPGGFIGPTVDRGLRLRIIEPRRRAHEHTMEAVGALAAVGADDQTHRQRGAILAGSQRAQIVGDALR